MTPIAAALGLLSHGLIWHGPIESRLDGGSIAVAIIASLEIIAPALLPGSYSIDAFRFGRRVLVLPLR
jgi:hypothetical protein